MEVTSVTTTGNHVPYGIKQCYLPPSSGDFPGFTPAQPKLVLDLAIQEEYKVELTWKNILQINSMNSM